MKKARKGGQASESKGGTEERRETEWRRRVEMMGGRKGRRAEAKV